MNDCEKRPRAVKLLITLNHKRESAIEIRGYRAPVVVVNQKEVIVETEAADEEIKTKTKTKTKIKIPDAGDCLWTVAKSIKTNQEPYMQGEWRRSAYPPRPYEYLDETLVADGHEFYADRVKWKLLSWIDDDQPLKYDPVTSVGLKNAFLFFFLLQKPQLAFVNHIVKESSL